MPYLQRPFIAALVVAAFSVPAIAQPCDPVEIQKLTATDPSAHDYFAHSVAVSGDTAVIGAMGDDTEGGFDAGSAHVFVRSGSTWIEQASLTVPDAASGDGFGFSVSISGDTAVLGAYRDDHEGGENAGSAYVFVRSGSTWTQQATLTASDAAASDSFGIAVAVLGDTVLIGAPYDDHGSAVNAGSAYVFVRSGAAWTEQARLAVVDSAADLNFGSAVALTGDTAVIGAPRTAFFDPESGSAYVFVRSGSTWTEQAKLTASDAAPFDVFGCSVAGSADTVLVGAYNDDHTGGTNAGSVYAFHRCGSTWTEQSKLAAADAAEGDVFGIFVAMSGDMAVIGSPGSNTGAAYLFVRSGATWIEQGKFTASDSAAGDAFGSAVALDGETACLGALLDDDGVASSGSAYLFSTNCMDMLEGACCLNGQCALMRQPQCEALGGTFHGVGITCSDAECAPACLADLAPSMGGDGIVNVDDLLAVLKAWGACSE